MRSKRLNTRISPVEPSKACDSERLLLSVLALRAAAAGRGMAGSKNLHFTS
eukprot:CAMPEP_0114631006 /NCGR_PEP_ID=MMETSP0168-20121206/14185_1 /TAXON_ID=95228 ORGANISM="Vannella sp., Strain DIVA3 517/6/12" /NCGR_SAMPLE_ID=MMETSP0168 /ASSEMBLY_ACC=CAM_ASM_000044 /LENGTH=50 /DNA_ID=CAMNT_0001842549 /DNA_START=132 /DNA_END=281 /DNA_ORIENTATION=+